MWSIALLIIVGMLLLMTELVLLPGLSIAGFGSLLSYGVAIYLGFAHFGTTGGFIVIAIGIVTAVFIVSVSLKSKTWQRFALKNNIDGKSQKLPEENNIKVGDRGITVTRLAPMGKISVGGITCEAKSIDSYIDPKVEIEVVGFENFAAIVKIIERDN